MPTICIDLDRESFRALAERAADERRPVAWQAEVIVLQAIGRWPATVHATPTRISQAPTEPAQ
jgi:sirohydrochlorin ferrochelatase